MPAAAMPTPIIGIMPVIISSEPPCRGVVNPSAVRSSVRGAWRPTTFRTVNDAAKASTVAANRPIPTASRRPSELIMVAAPASVISTATAMTVRPWR
jgi:hypothetical protein